MNFQSMDILLIPYITITFTDYIKYFINAAKITTRCARNREFSERDFTNRKIEKNIVSREKE